MNRTLKFTIGFKGRDCKIVDIEFNENQYYLKTYFDVGGGFYCEHASSQLWVSLNNIKGRVPTMRA
jgi:hypothetical protein